MATGDVIIRIRSDSKDFQADVDKARKRLDGLSKSSGDAANGLRDGAGALAKFKSALGDTAVYGGAATLLMGLAAIPVKAREAADGYSDILSKLRLATNGVDEMTRAHDGLFQIAQSTRTEFAATVDLYSGISMPLKEAGKSQQEILKFTELVSQGLQVSGSSASEAASTIRQLSQAMASGVLRGDEFNSLMENNKAIVQALADGLGKKTGELRAMAEAGLLKSETVFSAVMSQADKLDAKYKQITPTMEKAWVTVGNTALLEIGKIDQAMGISKSIASGLVGLADNMDVAFTGAGMAVSGLAGVMAVKGVTAATAYTSAKLTALAASRALAAQQAQESVTALAEAQATAALAANKVRVALLSREAAAAELVSARANMAAAVSVDAHNAALLRMQAAQVAVRTSSAALAAAKVAEAEATAAATVASTAGTAAASRMGMAIGLIGGPAGVAMLAGAGLYYLNDALTEERTTIELSTGVHIQFGEAMGQINKMSDEFLTASKERQEEIRAETQLIIEQAQARRIEAIERMRYLKNLKKDSEANADNMFRVGFNNLLGMWQAGDAEEHQATIDATANIPDMIKAYGNLGKTKEQIAEESAKEGGAVAKTAEEYEAAARAALAFSAATGKATAASVEAGKVLHSHGDAIKSLVESLTQQRIELENGNLAADYFAKRLQGLSDAEARAAIGAGQYNTYLEERKRLTREAADASGGLRSAYLARLDDMGLSTEAIQGIDAAKLATDKAVMASAAYQASIDKATESLKAQAEAAKAAGTSAAGAMSAQLGGIQKISSAAAASAAEVVEKLQALGWTRNQAIGIAANIKQESEFRPGAVGDGGKAYGLAQWHHDRQAIFHAVMGKNIQGSSVDDQLKFLTKEMFMQTGGGAGKRIKASDSAAEVAAIMSRYYERPKETEVEITRRAGIANAIAKSLGDSVPSFRAAAVEAGKVAPAIAAASPALDANASKTQQLADITVEYAGAIDGARVNQEGINGLVDDYMQGQADGLVKSAKDHLQQVTLTGAALREWELSQKEFNAGARERILLAEQSAEYAAEEVELQKALYGIRNQGIAATYVSGLSNKNLTKAQIGKLVNQKMGIEFEIRMTDLDGRAEQASMTADAYQRLTMARDGFTNSQIAGFQAWEREVRKMEEASEVNKRFADAFESDLSGALKSGELNFQGFADTVIDEITRLQVIKPLMESLFGNDGKGGLFNSGEGGLVGSISSMLGFADGGAFLGGAQMYANGGAFHNAVLHKPTQFFANGGLAVAGEAGPEAVMPLTRIGGKLGVMSAGGSNVTVQPQVHLNVINNAGVQVSSRQETDSQGNISMTMMIDQIEGAITDRARRGHGLANVFKRV